MSQDDDTRDATETDWLANSYEGYGFGYTKEQALTAMAAYNVPFEHEVDVQLVEHVGDIEMWLGGFRAEEFVQGQVATISAEKLNKLGEVAAEAQGAAEEALADAQVEEIETR